MADKAKLNKEYEDATKTRQENAKLDIVPLAPEFRSKDEVMSDLTLQRELLKRNIDTIMPPSQANKFMGRVFNNISYILMINKYFKDIEDVLPKDLIISASFFKAFVDRFFLTQKRTKGIDPFVNPGDYESVQGQVSSMAIPDVTLTGNDLIRATRQVIKDNYPSATGIDIDSPKYDNQILRFYVAHHVIRPTNVLKEGDWAQIYQYETKKHEGEIKDTQPVPFASFTEKKAKELTDEELLIRQLRQKKGSKSVTVPSITTAVSNRLAEGDPATFSYVTPPTETTMAGTYTPTPATTPASRNIVVRPRRQKSLRPSNVIRRQIGGGFFVGSRKVGAGIEPNQHDVDPYIEFGRYVLNVPLLKKQQLQLKYKSLGAIPQLPKQFISSELADFLLDLVENKKMNVRMLDTLNDHDRKLLANICFKAQAEETLGFGLKVVDDDKAEFDRFQLLKGELVAGNNSPQVLKEIKGYILKFMSTGRISKSDGYNILAEIMILT